MAKNPNKSLPNLNTFYAAMSGGGKSQAVKAQKSSKRVISWDPDEDHKVKCRVYSVTELVAYLRQHGHKAGFSVGYSGDNSVKAFELYCAAAWAVLDGRMRTDIIIEELADVTPSSGKAGQWSGPLIRRVRKYNGVLHAVTQRPAEVPKTIYTQCSIKYIGQQEGDDLPRMAKHAGVDPAILAGLKPLEFIRKANGAEPEKVQFKYKK